MNTVELAKTMPPGLKRMLPNPLKQKAKQPLAELVRMCRQLERRPRMLSSFIVAGAYR